MENINLNKFKKILSPKLIVKISSLFAEQSNGSVNIIFYLTNNIKYIYIYIK